MIMACVRGPDGIVVCSTVGCQLAGHTGQRRAVGDVEHLFDRCFDLSFNQLLAIVV
jgi:hypothetical protein